VGVAWNQIEAGTMGVDSYEDWNANVSRKTRKMFERFERNYFNSWTYQVKLKKAKFK